MKNEEKRKILQFEKVTKEYSLGDRKLQVLKGIDFEIHQGEFAAIMGPSGGGKSTLLQLIGCLDKPTSGRVLIDGIDVSKLNSGRLSEIRAKKIGFIFQAFNLLPNQTALHNVEIAMSITEVPKNERIARAKKLLGIVGLSDRENHKPNMLSGGEKQRVAIARALANNPSFLLADEPTGNLDSKSGTEIMELFMEIWEKNHTTIIMVTHEPVVAQYSQKIIHLRDGEIESIAQTKKNLKIMDLKSK